MLPNLFLVLCTIVTFFFYAAASTAEPLTQQGPLHNHDKEWAFGIGLLGRYSPCYEGADSYEINGSPLFSISWHDRFFLTSYRGLGAIVWKSDDCKLGLSIGSISGRDEDDADHLRGLGDIDGGASANIFFERAIGNFTLDVHYEHQVTGEDTGFQAHAGLGYDLRISKKITLQSTIKTTYASSDYMDTYFAVSPLQAVQSGYPVYRADAGLKSIGFQLTTAYKLNRHWELQARTGYDRLVGDAADSPMVKNANQYQLSAGLAYKFAH